MRKEKDIYKNYSSSTFLILIITSVIMVNLVVIDYKFLIVFLIPMIIYIFWKNTVLSVFILILINENFFYLKFVNFNYKLSNLLILILCITISIIKLLRNNEKLLFKNQILVISALISIEIIVAKIVSNQEILDGFDMSINLQKYLMYFYIYLVMVRNKKAEKVVSMTIITSVAISIIYTIQAFLYPKIIFLNMIYFQREGRTRFYTGIAFIIFSIFLCIEKYYKENKKKYILYFAIMTFEVIFVGQTRNITIVLMFMFIIYLFKNFHIRSINIKKLISISFFSTIFFIFLLKSNYIYDIFYSSIMEVKTKTGSAGFRINEIYYYIGGFLKRPLLGNGLYYDGSLIGFEVLGRQYGYFQNDIGVLGSLFTFGVIGISAFLYLLFKIFKISKNIENNKKYHKIILSSKLLVYFIILSIFFMFYMDNGGSVLYITIIMCYLEYTYKSLLNIEEGDSL